MKGWEFASRVVSEVINRLPIERLITRPPDTRKRLEDLQEILSTSPSQKKQETPTPTERGEALHQMAEKSRTAGDVSVGCIPCAINHFATCSGLLAEAMRFARKDGLGSDEVLDRINKCLDELNAMERVDLATEKIYNLPAEEKELANHALNASRAARHALESLESVDGLEQVTADVQAVRKVIGREWYRYRLGKIPKEELTEAEVEAEISVQDQN